MAMSMPEVLAKNDLDLTTVMTPDGLKSLVKVYESLLETLTADTETQQNREKEVRDSLKSDQYKNLASGTGVLVRSALADVMNDDPNLSVVLVDLLQEIKQDVMTFRDFHVAAIVRETKPEKVKDADAETRKEEAKAMRDAILSIFGLLGKPTNVIETKKNKEGEVVPVLPRIPGGNTSGNVGRGAIIRQMRFTLDGEDLPEGTLLYDMLQTHLNNLATGEVITVKEFKDLVEETGSEFAPKGSDNAWTVEVFGKTLTGWVPTEE